MVLILGGRACVNSSSAPDWIVAPLFVPDTGGNADVIVVLGAAVVGECGVNLNGLRRVHLAARLFKQGRASQMLITGGPAGRPCPVAQAMADAAVEFGIPRDRIQLEVRSQSTRENADYSATMLHAADVKRILLVTDRLHMRRVAGVFSRKGFELEFASVPIYEGHIDNSSMLWWGLREYAALLYYHFAGWMTLSNHDSGAAGTSGRTPAADGARRPIVILGASYAADWPLTGVADVPVVNKGVGGQQPFEFVARFASDVAALNPQAVIIWGFINAPLRASPDNEVATAAKVRADTEALVRMSRAQGITPILATELPLGVPAGVLENVMAILGPWLGRQSYQDSINQQVRSINEWLRAYSRTEGLTVIDMESVVVGPRGLRKNKYTQPDGSHVTPEGYEALTATAVPLLERHLAGNVGRWPR